MVTEWSYTIIKCTSARAPRAFRAVPVRYKPGTRQGGLERRACYFPGAVSWVCLILFLSVSVSTNSLARPPHVYAAWRRRTSGGRRAEVAAAVAASEATSATTPRRSRGRPSGRGITRSLLRGRPSSSTASGSTRAAPWRRRSCWRSSSRLTTGMSVAVSPAIRRVPGRTTGASATSATATTCCAAGARAVGTRRGDGPCRGLAPKADGATN